MSSPARPDDDPTSPPGRSTTLPPMKDLTTENITANVHLVNSSCPDPRLRYLVSRIVEHLHTFARETRLSTAEWHAGIQFLTEIGQISTELRHEMILLSDTLGLSSLVDSINHPRREPATEGTVLGPFHTHDAMELSHGANLHQNTGTCTARDDNTGPGSGSGSGESGTTDGNSNSNANQNGTPLLVLCTVKNTTHQPLSDVKIDVWESDAHGFYDTQYPDRDKTKTGGPNGRGILRSDTAGRFYFRAIVPVPYPIPSDGPVGRMLKVLGRHVYRPGHVHFMLEKEGYDLLVTALYPRGDPYETSDAVFGVKESLVVDLTTVKDPDMAQRYGVDVGTPLLTYEFVLLTDKEARDLRRQEAIEAMKKRGRKMVFVDGDLPVPEDL